MTDSTCGKGQMAAPLGARRLAVTHNTCGPISTLTEVSERLDLIYLIYVIVNINFDVILMF
jgi:hypothetical protein